MLTFDELSSDPDAFQELTGLDVAAFEALFERFDEAQKNRRKAERLPKRPTRPGDKSEPRLSERMSYDDYMYVSGSRPKTAPLDPRYQEIVLRHGEPRHWREKELRRQFGVYSDWPERWSPRAVRRRRLGAGRKHNLDERTRLLMARIWLRVYPTYEVLGGLFGLSKSNAMYNVKDVLETLDILPRPPLAPGPHRKKRWSTHEIRQAFPRAAKWVV